MDSSPGHSPLSFANWASVYLTASWSWFSHWKGKKMSLAGKLVWRSRRTGRDGGQLARSQCPVTGQGKHWHDELSSKEWERRQRERSKWGNGRKRRRQLNSPGVSGLSFFLVSSTEVLEDRRRLAPRLQPFRLWSTCEVVYARQRWAVAVSLVGGGWVVEVLLRQTITQNVSFQQRVHLNLSEKT